MAELDLRALVEAVPDVVAIVDRDHRYVFANAALARATGTSVVGKRNDEVMAGADATTWREALDDVLANGGSREVECALTTPQGARQFAAVLTRINGDQVCAIWRDITEARAAQALERARRDERAVNETLHLLAASFASELDQDRLLRLITDEVSRLVDAQVATFRFASGDEAVTAGDASMRTELLNGELASILAVSVSARSGELFGTLLLGHRNADHFTEAHARLATSIASQAAVALENAHLYKAVRAQKEQLEVAVTRARLADRRKDEFLAMLSHELRNPLAPIATALELMDLKGVGELRRERDVIRRQVDHLSRLIDDLLDVSRITRGKIQLERKVVEIASVLAKAIEMASPMLEKRMHPLSIEVPHTGLLVDADPSRLAQVFQNLLTNAAKYSDERAPISLTARAEADHVVVALRDEGIGIAAELQPHLFGLFVQGERTLDRSQGGLGIGLTVAKSLCELHGGTIDVASDGIGKGSTFTVTLPLVASTRADEPQPTEPRPRTTPQLGGAARVLVVDDNVDAAQMLRDYIAALGHEPAVAHDGPAALELASSFKPDIAVLDIGLPVMNGYELARRLRETLGLEKLRLIALTGYGQDADKAQALEVGFDHHLIKPIDLNVLLPLLVKD
ncbi:MAG TPA: ATP-binding protein [Kofleriaceae bacterium]